MAETKCERCLYYGACCVPSGCGCEEYIDEELAVEAGREQYRKAFLAYLDAFENE